MLETLKSAALAAVLVVALLWTSGTITKDPVPAAKAYQAKTVPSTGSERNASSAEGRTLPCTYDGDFTNDPPGCK